MTYKNTLPLLSLRDVVLFPGMVAPLFLGRKSAIDALHAARTYDSGDHILLTTQKKPEIDEPKSDDLHKIGVIGKIIQVIKLPNDTLKILVDIEQRVSLKCIENEKFPLAEYQALPDEPIEDLREIEDVIEEIILNFTEYVRLNKKINPDIIATVTGQKNPTYITNIVSSHLTCKLDRKQEILEIANVEKRAKHLLMVIETEISLMETEQSVQSQVKKQIEKSQRDYF
jgi:ATP-dependent Lon protease